MDDVPNDVVSRLIDLSNVDLADLDGVDNPVLASTLRKIRDETEHPGEAIAGWNSSL